MILVERDPLVLRENRRYQPRVLLVHCARDHREAAERDAEIQADVERVADARPAAHADDDLVLLARRHDLIEHRHQRTLAAIQDALPSQRDDVHVGEDGELGFGSRRRDDALVEQRLAHEMAAQMGAGRLGWGQRHGTLLTGERASTISKDGTSNERLTLCDAWEPVKPGALGRRSRPSW